METVRCSNCGREVNICVNDDFSLYQSKDDENIYAIECPDCGHPIRISCVSAREIVWLFKFKDKIETINRKHPISYYINRKYINENYHKKKNSYLISLAIGAGLSIANFTMLGFEVNKFDNILGCITLIIFLIVGITCFLSISQWDMQYFLANNLDKVIDNYSCTETHNLKQDLEKYLDLHEKFYFRCDKTEEIREVIDYVNRIEEEDI